MVSVALSDRQILSALSERGIRAQVVEFPDLADASKYPNIDSVLGPGGVAVIYLRTGPDFGHWACVFKRGKEVEVFDSSGHAISVDVLSIPRDMREQLSETEPFLLEILEDPRRCPYPVCVNGTDFQQFTEGVNTCGRWVVWRLLHRQLDDAQFKALMDKARRPGESYDQEVARLTLPVFGV